MPGLSEPNNLRARPMSISRREIEHDLTVGGLTQRVQYLGFVPVKVPVHEMTPDMRSLLLKHSIDSLELLSQDKPPPPRNSLIPLMLGEPKLVNKHVDIVISAQFISLVRDDGSPMLRVPMKFTSVIERMEHSDCIAFIAKRLDESQRRCTVFKTDKSETAERIMQIMSHAMEICNEEQARAEKEASPTPSGSATPVVTPGYPSIAFPPSNIVCPPLVPPGTGRRQTPLPCHRIRVGPRATELAQYRWYHGFLTRTEATARLRQPGDFLIRESENQRGQVILSGISDSGDEKHLLLIDSEGKVKTQEQDFNTVAELVKYYMEEQVVIAMAGENQVRLLRPIDRPH